MQVNLDTNEVSAVVKALKSYLGDLHDELGSTESYNMREDLKQERLAIRDVISKLGGNPDDTGLSDIGANKPPWG
ncbi:MAG: hypothetical protein ABI670_10875 [Chloroflexota bacterium]|jgi:hypothetical protein